MSGQPAPHEWTPPPELGSHAGLPIGKTAHFCWSPPAAIGDILSADSTVERGRTPSIWKPWLIAAGISVVTYVAFGEVMPVVIAGKGDPNIVRLIALCLALFCGPLSLLWTWPKRPQCTYLGTEGAAMLTGRWGNPTPTESQTILFNDMQVLYSSATHMYKNFMYQNTFFGFQWHAHPSAAAAMSISGEHGTENDPPPPSNIYHFGQRTEERWTDLLIQRHDSEIATTQSITFPCRRNPIQQVRLHCDSIEFVYKNRAERLALTDLGNFDAKRGVLHFDQNDASWFGSQGKFRLNYGDLGNARLFVIYLSRLLGTT